MTFLDTKIKSNDTDPDKKWITTWNDYLLRIKYFLRWFHNHKLEKDRKEEPFSVKGNLMPKLRIPEKHDIFLRQITHGLYWI